MKSYLRPFCTPPYLDEVTLKNHLLKWAAASSNPEAQCPSCCFTFFSVRQISTNNNNTTATVKQQHNSYSETTTQSTVKQQHNLQWNNNTIYMNLLLYQISPSFEYRKRNSIRGKKGEGRRRRRRRRTEGWYYLVVSRYIYLNHPWRWSGLWRILQCHNSIQRTHCGWWPLVILKVASLNMIALQHNPVMQVTQKHVYEFSKNTLNVWKQKETAQ